jgi:hypothetical protein
MSPACHFFCGGVFGWQFWFRVYGIVTVIRAFDQKTLPFQTSCVVAGTSCLVSTNSYDVLHATARWRSAPATNCASCFEMQILVDEALDNLPEQAGHFRGRRHFVFALLPPRSFVAYDLLRRRAHATLSLAAAGSRAFWDTLLLPITIGVLGTTIGIVPLHSACLEHNGAGVLVAGPPGAGKSTLATALGKLGFALISDDWIYVSDQQSALVAYSLSSPVKLLPDAVRFFEELQNLSPRTTLNGEFAYEFDPQSSMQIATKNISHPRTILFLERTSTPGCYMVPCRADYVRDFFRENAEKLPDEIPEAKAFREKIIEKLASCRSWILRTGENPARTAEAVQKFLAEDERAQS